MRAIDGSEALGRSRSLRKSATEAEKILWRELRNRRLAGFKFRRQFWIGPFITDFACFEAKLVVEADGSQHGENRNYDVGRDAYLRDEGYRVIRVWNNELTGNLDGVLEAIRAALLERVHSGCYAAGFALSSCPRHDDALRPSHSALPSGPLPLPQGEEK